MWSQTNKCEHKCSLNSLVNNKTIVSKKENEHETNIAFAAGLLVGAGYTVEKITTANGYSPQPYYLSPYAHNNQNSSLISSPLTSCMDQGSLTPPVIPSLTFSQMVKVKSSTSDPKYYFYTTILATPLSKNMNDSFSYVATNLCQFKNYGDFYQSKLNDLSNNIDSYTYRDSDSYGSYSPALDAMLQGLENDPNNLDDPNNGPRIWFGSAVLDWIKNKQNPYFNDAFKRYVQSEYKKSFPNATPEPPTLTQILTISKDRKTITTNSVIQGETAGNIVFIYSKN